MFGKKLKQQTEANVIDVMRKYAPYLLAATVAVGTLASLYYGAYGEAVKFIKNGFGDAGSSIDDATAIVQQSQYTAAEDAGLDGSTAIW
ncbi:MAG: hypothetical protein Q7J10_03655 [Methanosarcinaceae archaeon]|nr:hypothetical protein [Methanosarcinaceae archaeon]